MIFGNGGDGVSIARTGNATTNFIRVNDNQISGNVDDGVQLSASGTQNDDLDVLVTQNIVNGNADDGIVMVTVGDGIVNATIDNNTITGNGDDGIATEDDRFTVDQGVIIGSITRNTITGNGVNNPDANFGNGIEITGASQNLQIGSPISGGNLISQNGGAGISLLGSGNVTVANNMITQNGSALPNTLEGAGINIDGQGFKTYNVVNNLILDNRGDGVEITNIGNGLGFDYDLTFVDNVVARNTGRGYDILNGGSGFSSITIRGTAPGRSMITENGEEGVYVVNTASAAANQQNVVTPNFVFTDPTHGLDNSGSVTANSTLLFNFDNNDVIANGLTAATGGVPAKGLVLRVGTTGGGYSQFQTGGFAPDGNGGVIATITNNRLAGNIGADFYVDSFTSTVPPAVTNGDDATFTVTNYVGDPLARLDLQFTGNTFDDIAVNNLGAFYNNAEPNFKSRLNNKVAPSPNGPFTNATRRRNAQRLAFRDGLPPAVNPGFQYPGEGMSTFRVRTDVPGLFIFDDIPYITPANANGVSLPGSIAGELPYGWTRLP